MQIAVEIAGGIRLIFFLNRRANHIPSGAKADLTGQAALMTMLRAGDTVVIGRLRHWGGANSYTASSV